MSNSSTFRKHMDFAVLDLIILIASFCVAYFLKFDRMPAILKGKLEPTYAVQINTIVVAFFLVLVFGSPYKNILKRSRWQELLCEIKLIAFLVSADLFVLFLTHYSVSISREFLAVSWSLFFAFQVVVRAFWKAVLRTKYTRRDGKDSMILVAHSKEAGKIISELQKNPFRTFNVNAVFVENDVKKIPQYTGVRFVGRMDECVEYASHNWVDEVTIDGQISAEARKELVTHFEVMGITIHTIVTEMKGKDQPGIIKTAENIGRYITVSR